MGNEPVVVYYEVLVPMGSTACRVRKNTKIVPWLRFENSGIVQPFSTYGMPNIGAKIFYAHHQF
jgi:hypothetical protein